MININDFPNEILEFILSLLPPYKDLENTKFVCKRWQKLTNNVISRKHCNLHRGIIDFNLCWKTELSISALSPKIAARFAHSTCLHDNSMYVFGGASSTNTTFNDLWRFDLSKREWIRPVSMGSYPSPKAGATLVVHGDSLILFGGWRHSMNPPFQMCTLFDELHSYDIKENRWSIYNLPFGPPPTTGHSTTVQNNSMIIFGGYQNTCETHGTSNDVWLLELDKMVWRKPIIAETSAKPVPRYGQFQTAIDDKHLLILGGNGGPNNKLNDAWILDMSSDVWRWKNIPVKNKKLTATHMWYYPVCNVGEKIITLAPISANNFQYSNIAVQLFSNVNRIGENNQQMPQQMHQQHQPAANPAINPRNRLFDNNRREINDNRNVNRQQQQPQQQQQPPQPAAQINPNHNADNINGNVGQGGGGGGPSSSGSRFQRNPHLFRNVTDDDHMLPKRFSQQNIEQGQLGMAAFQVQPSNNPIVSPRERQLERLRRMEEKISAMRRISNENGESSRTSGASTSQSSAVNLGASSSNSNNNERPSTSSARAVPTTPKLINRNSLAIFVCDISNILSPTDPCIEWVETKSCGILAGAPEKFTFATFVNGVGELIMFGGLITNSNYNDFEVSNTIHFLTVPTTVV
uniref:Putative f-box only protein 42 n=1 Tax=Corethrella appendiculata TaxID=1370023 RepID=U5EVF4_9DIPT